MSDSSSTDAESVTEARAVDAVVDPSAPQDAEPVSPAESGQADAFAEYQEFMGPLDIKPPEYGAEGLVLLWDFHQPRRTSGSDTTSDSSADSESAFEPVLDNFDVVVVHGLHGARRPPWKNPGSGDSSWVAHPPYWNRRVMSFGYSASKLLAGRFTRQAIRRASRSLLSQLSRRRAADTPGRAEGARPIMFIAHDIGGIIVKDALTVAGLEPLAFGDIFDFTRVLIFYGCPHRSSSCADMEDRLVPLLFSHGQVNGSPMAGSTEVVRGLAGAAVHVNGLFMDSRHTFRSYIVSVTASPTDQTNIDPAFDEFAGTLGVAFELRIPAAVPWETNNHLVKEHLRRINSEVCPNPSTINHERSLLCVASPIPSMLTADGPNHRFAWIGDDDTYKAWYGEKQAQILYIHGRSGVREAAEYVFYHLDEIHHQRNNEIVLYFTFENSDVRCDRVEDMLTSFLAQIIGHFPSLAEFVTGQFERLSKDRSWNDYDLLNWFEYYRLRGEVEGVSCVINHFDQCDGESRKAFLELFSYIATVNERPWRVAVTSLEPGALSEELASDNWPVLDLDLASTGAAPLEARNKASSLVSRRPELRGLEAQVEAELSSFEVLEPEEKRLLVSAYVSASPEWPREKQVGELLGDVSNMSTPEVLARILENMPDRDLGLRALSWILYAMRPPTVWELASALLSGTDRDDGKTAIPPQGFVDDVITFLSVSLAGVVVLEQHEFRVCSYRLRDMLKSPADERPHYPWHDFQRTAHHEIAAVCLNHLVKDEVTRLSEHRFPVSSNSVAELPTSGDRTDLFDYAVQFWPSHLSQVPAELDPGAEFGKLMQTPGTFKAWSRAYWAAANPIKRSTWYLSSVYPILTGLGMSELAEPWREGEEDEVSTGLIEACLNGQRDAVKELLPKVEHSVMALQDSLVAAGSHGDGDTWIEVIEHVESKHPGLDWTSMASLVSRAAWLGLDKVLVALLRLGCPVEPEEAIQKSSPLHLAARTGRIAVAKVLLRHGADVHHRDAYERTPLHTAACFGHAGVAKLLAEHGADLDAKDDQGLTAIYQACLWGNFNVVESLLSAGANPNLGVEKDPELIQWYPILVAVQEGHLKCASALLDGGAEPNVQGHRGTAVRYAAVTGFPDLCRRLLQNGADPNHPSIDPPILCQLTDVRYSSGIGSSRMEVVRILVESGADPNSQGRDGRPALYSACWDNDAEGMMDVLEYMIRRGADVNKAWRGMSLLQVACVKDSLPLIRLLVDNGVDLGPQGPRTMERNPLCWTVGHVATLRFLLDRGVDPDMRQGAGWFSPLMLSVSHNYPEAVQVLLEHKAHVDGLFSGRAVIGSPYLIWSPISLAVSKGHSDLVRTLGDAGADVALKMDNELSLVHFALWASTETLKAVLEFRPDVNASDTWLNTPLHSISSQTPLENVKLLVRAGADFSRANKAGVTPLARAVAEQNEAVVLFYLSKGADPNIASPVYGGPLHMACKRRAHDIAKALVAAGADVGLVIEGVFGTPVQCCTMAPDDGDPGDDESGITMIEFLLSRGADPTSVGGALGCAASVACWRGSSHLLSFLLRCGASVSPSDPMGRLPIHFASVRGEEQLRLVVDAGGDVLARDRAGRTALHWAAQGGDVDALKRVLSLTGDEAVDQPDVGGWTALCWAARGSGTSLNRRQGESQLEVVTELVRRGANIRVQPESSGKRWTPLSIAKYHDAPEEVVRILAPSGEEDKAEAEGAVDEEEVPNGGNTATKAAKLNPWPGVRCDYCLFNVYGLRYTCKECPDFDLCYRCYHSREEIHPADHSFDERGPEYEEPSDSEATTETSSEADESDGASSDADSNSDESP